MCARWRRYPRERRCGSSVPEAVAPATAAPGALRIAPEVAAALAEGRPIVALETAILTHGLPRPDNLETALGMEEVVRSRGAVPATIGIVRGRPCIGLTPAELEILAEAEDARKCSTRDLALLVARGGCGGTTVAASLYLAVRAGIRILATGGIGGVHRGGEVSLDISADLHELGRSPGLVVCSGAKAILDLPRTMEVLETLSVAVVGYRTDRLPAFYVERSEIAVPRIDTVADLAGLYRAQQALGWPGSLVVARPPPAAFALDAATFEALLARCRRRATAEGIRGAAETPYLLACLAELSQGRTIALNRALVLANAGLAAELAVTTCRTG